MQAGEAPKCRQDPQRNKSRNGGAADKESAVKQAIKEFKVPMQLQCNVMVRSSN
jgi:hypothetical protein